VVPCSDDIMMTGVVVVGSELKVCSVVYSTIVVDSCPGVVVVKC